MGGGGEGEGSVCVCGGGGGQGGCSSRATHRPNMEKYSASRAASASVLAVCPPAAMDFRRVAASALASAFRPYLKHDATSFTSCCSASFFSPYLLMHQSCTYSAMSCRSFIASSSTLSASILSR